MLKKIFYLVILFITTNPITYSQVNLTNWKSHTSLLDIRSICVDSNDNFWAATSGGAYKYNRIDSTFEEFRNIDALLTIDLSEVSADKDNIYFGSNNGVLEIFNLKKGWSHILDIKNAGFTNPRINDIVSYNGKVYIAGGFGLTVFNPKENIFIEDVKRFGNFPAQIEVKKILIKNNEIWLATTNGITKANLSGSLADKNIWTTYADSVGSFEKYLFDMIDIVVAKNEIYACSENLVLKLVNDKFEKIINNLANINSLSVFNNSLRIAYNEGIYNLDFQQTTYYSNISKLFDFNSKSNLGSGTIFSYKTGGFAIIDEKSSTPNLILPNSPLSNNFIYIEKGNNNDLWACSGRDNGKGLMSLKNNKWINLTINTYPKIRTNAFVKLSAINNSIYCGTYGAGQVIIKDSMSTFVIDTLTNNNSPFQGIGGANNWVIVGNSKLDKYGNVWSVNWASDRANVLVKQSKDGTLKGYKNCFDVNNTNYFTLDIDNNDTKWVGSSTSNVTSSGELNIHGLYYFNDNGTPDNLNDDYCGTLTTAKYPTLRNMIQTDIKVDKTGYIWIGTPSGVAVIVNPSIAISGNNPSFIVREIKQLKDLNVRQIMIDALNNKWIATTKGVYVLNPDGTEVISIFNSSNTPLPVNEVFSMANDPNTGEIYFGTQKGLYIANSLSIEPQDAFSISCYPQPFNRNTDEYLVIDGLTINSELKITTLDGELVKSLKSNSKRTIWDGKNENGILAKSGVYMIIANSSSNESKEVAKIMVVDK